MKRSLFITGLFATSLALTLSQADEKDGWVSLFDGKTLNGWKSNEAGESSKSGKKIEGVFTVEDGAIKVKGGRAHLFYAGDVNGAKFKNFEFKAKVKTTEGGNSGIYFHTAFQEEGWPKKGYECQVNSTHTDRRKTASLYAIKDVMDKAPSIDDEWFDYYIKVEGKKVTIKINDKVVNEYEEPADVKGHRTSEFAERIIDQGTFCFQGHDPNSTTYFKDIMVKPLK